MNAVRMCSERTKNDKRSSTYDVVELFSSHQVTARARQRGLREGWSLKKTFLDPITIRTGDLLNPKDVKTALNLIFQAQPKLLVAFTSSKPQEIFMIKFTVGM